MLAGIWDDVHIILLRLWSVQGMTLLPEVRYPPLFEMLPSGADSNGHKISADPALNALSGFGVMLSLK